MRNYGKTKVNSILKQIQMESTEDQIFGKYAEQCRPCSEKYSATIWNWVYLYWLWI